MSLNRNFELLGPARQIIIWPRFQDNRRISLRPVPNVVFVCTSASSLDLSALLPAAESESQLYLPSWLYRKRGSSRLMNPGDFFLPYASPARCLSGYITTRLDDLITVSKVLLASAWRGGSPTATARVYSSAYCCSPEFQSLVGNEPGLHGRSTRDLCEILESPATLAGN